MATTDETCWLCGGFGLLGGPDLNEPKACPDCGTVGPEGVADEPCPECTDEDEA